LFWWWKLVFEDCGLLGRVKVLISILKMEAILSSETRVI
jgi:hypothetical protein